MELSGKGKKFPALFWVGYVSAVVSDLVSGTAERGRCYDGWQGFVM